MSGREATQSRTLARLLVAAGLAAFVTAVYVVVVLGGGALLDVAPPSLPLAVLATAVVAVTLEPVRRALHRRLLSTPYDVLAAFATQVSAAVATDDVAPRMARLLAEGTGASRVEVWLLPGHAPTDRRGQELAARWPPNAAPVDPADPAVHLDDVVHDGVPLARILRDTGSGTASPLHPVEQRLLDDLLASAGLALRTVALTTGLRHRIAETTAQAAEIRVSRERIVTTADAARHRLERDIHDGAQQHLVALAVNLGLATTVSRQDPARAVDVVDDLRRAAEEAYRTLDELSRGVWPRPLTEGGLVAALEAAAAGSPLPVHVQDAAHRRLPPDAEAALYFSCLEAVQNAVKHSGARSVVVCLGLEEDGRRLRVEVRDDGDGFVPEEVAEGTGLRSMRDRVESLGGELVVLSRPGLGTTVTCRVPVAAGPEADLDSAGARR